ncbi:MAG: sulfatase-like hydrolase/transferase [Candidatus Hydrogenedentota bacterium]
MNESRRPNIVWIWADNLAYGDLPSYGNDRIKTPVLDKMASEGVRFMQYYVAHTVCSPSRAALLTGRQPFRAGVVDVLRPDGPSGLPDDEITIADALKTRGYATATFGKWHLGDRKEFLPLQRGFDHYLGLPYSMDMLPTLLYRDNEIQEELPGDKVEDVTERLVDGAIDFIAANKDKPFFIYFNHTIPHPPLNIPERYLKEGLSVYECALEYMDEQTGRILDALKEHGLDENTLVVFTSDNGPMAKDGDAGGLRGRIRDSYEGGIRVPFIARWPNHIPAGSVQNEPAIAYDIFPTVLRLAGAKMPDDRIYDGQNIWPLLSSQGTIEREKPFVWVYLDNVTSVRDGKWKFHVANRDKTFKTPELYNLETDPQESTPVNDDHPDVVKRLTAFVDQYSKDIPYVWTLKYPVRDPAKRNTGVRRE